MRARPRSRVVGLVAPFGPRSDHVGMLPFVETVARSLRERDHDLLLVTADEGAAGLQRLADRGVVDAVVVMEVAAHDERIPVARRLDLPVVFIGVPEDSTGVTCIDVDFAAGGALGVAELVASGCRSAALLGHPRSTNERGIGYVRRFQRGALQEARDRGLPLQVVTPVELERTSVDTALDVVLSEEDEQGVLPGLLLSHDEALPGVLRALEDRGLEPGVHLAVVALCTDELAASLAPPLTSVSQEPREVSERAVAAVFRLMDATEDDDARPRVELVQPRLTRRASTPATRIVW
ncbi:MAG: substrate-binding domain-containing protein [Quadrisphaera sp.]